MRKRTVTTIARWTTPLWLAALAGVVVGTAIGVGLTLHPGGASEATALVRVYQPVDPDQIMTGTGPSPAALQSYVSGEITYLTSHGFIDAVAKQLNQTSPLSLSATQQGQSTLIALSATQGDVPEAQRTVDAAIKVYSDHVEQQTRERGQAAIDALNGVISRLLQADSQSTDGRAVASSTSDAPSDRQARIQQLELQRLAIEAQTRRAPAIQVVQPATNTPEKGAPRWSLGAVGGGVIGGLLALAGAAAWRKRIGVLTSPSALEGQFDHVLLPTVRLGALIESSAAYAGLALSLYAQLATPRSGRILLIGASADSGTAEVAGLLAFAAAEHAPVRVEHLRDHVNAYDGFTLSANLMDGATAIIVGGSIETAPALPQAAEKASQIIVVAMIGRDVLDTVSMASQLARTRDVPISAVATRGTLLTNKPARRHTSHPKHAAGDSIVDAPAVVGAPALRRSGNDIQSSPRTDAAASQRLGLDDGGFNPASKTVTVGRFSRGLHRINVLLASVAGMKSALGALLWVGAFAALGYLAGEHFAEFTAAFDRYRWYVLGALVMIAATVITRRVRRRRSGTVA